MISIMAMYLAIYLHAEVQGGRWSYRRTRSSGQRKPGASREPKLLHDMRSEGDLKDDPSRQASAPGGDDCTQRAELQCPNRERDSRSCAGYRASDANSARKTSNRSRRSRILSSHSQRLSIGENVISEDMRRKRESVRRQLRLLFIYPLCYFLIFLVPFISHLTTYSNYRAQHPYFALSMMSSLCLASIGFMDCLVFSLRERPWRHIPGSDRTFLGSFVFWKHDPAKSGEDSLSSFSPSGSGHKSRGSRAEASAGSQAIIPRSRGSEPNGLTDIDASLELRLSGSMRGPWKQPQWAEHVRDSTSGFARQEQLQEDLHSIRQMDQWGFPGMSDRAAEEGMEKVDTMDTVLASTDMANGVEGPEGLTHGGGIREQDWFNRSLSVAVGRIGLDGPH